MHAQATSWGGQVCPLGCNSTQKPPGAATRPQAAVGSIGCKILWCRQWGPELAGLGPPLPSFCCHLPRESTTGPL